MTDAEFSKRILQRLYCQKCGSGDGLECSHVYPKRFTELRHCHDNALALCRWCHRWWHAHPKESQRWFIRTFPVTYHDLKTMAGVGLKWEDSSRG